MILHKFFSLSLIIFCAPTVIIVNETPSCARREKRMKNEFGLREKFIFNDNKEFFNFQFFKNSYYSLLDSIHDTVKNLS